MMKNNLNHSCYVEGMYPCLAHLRLGLLIRFNIASNFPAYSPGFDSMLREEQIFFKALELNGRNRDAYLEASCNGDIQMQNRVNSLIECHDSDSFILDEPDKLDLLVGEPMAEVEKPGMKIGNFKLLQQIGEGGMGLVFMAEQLSPVRREVAIKVIKGGLDTRRVIHRFEAERQALAVMSHPNITRVLDAGVTDSGRPFFVMELVKGTTLTEYCDENQIGIQGRLQLFAKVCGAIHHAHQKGVIHRDIKPSNIMVTLHDGEPVPKVIDFGIAKALNRRLTDSTLFTRYGELIGTPEYMSPEQAEMSGLDLDIRSDVYSLGVLLYELLTGSTPIDKSTFKDAGLLKICETIRDLDAETPSEKVTPRVESSIQVASNRQLTPAALSRFLKGDLDWIVMRALSKNRNDRYESAAAFARDIRQYIAGEPVEAARPTFGYRFTKFYNKHKIACTLSAALACTLVVASVISTIFAFHATQSAAVANDRLIELEKQKHFAEKQREQALENLQRAEIAEAHAEKLARDQQKQLANANAIKEYLIGGMEMITVGDAQSLLLEPNSGKQESKSIAGENSIGNFDTDDSQSKFDEDKIAELLEAGDSAIGLVIPNDHQNQTIIRVADSEDLGKLPESVQLVRSVGNESGTTFPFFVKTPRQKIKLLELILKNQRKAFGSNDVLLVGTLKRLARLFGEVNELEKAELAFRECVEILKSSETQDELPAIYELLARNLERQNKHLQAEKYRVESN